MQAASEEMESHNRQDSELIIRDARCNCFITIFPSTTIAIIHPIHSPLQIFYKNLSAILSHSLPISIDTSACSLVVGSGPSRVVGTAREFIKDALHRSVSECSHVARARERCQTHIVILSELRARKASQDGTHVFVNQTGDWIQRVQCLAGKVRDALLQELECETGEIVSLENWEAERLA